tara:strand:- start:47 stop:223 length:177 start_codon:yes stop_codon:yes gene_type:complete
MIQTVEKNYIDKEFENYKVTLTDNTIVWVPHNEANRHYIEIQEWVAEGNTITDNGGGE